MSYDDNHRRFLQVILQSGATLEQDAMELSLKIFQMRKDVADIVAVINTKLSPLNMSIVSATCEVTGNIYWCLVNNIYEANLALPSKYSQNERAYLRLLYSEMLHSELCCIPSNVALNLVSKLEDARLSVADADRFLKDLFKNHWLKITEDGIIYLGVRTIAEMLPYFRETFAEQLSTCILCRKVMFYGHNCEHCGTPYHNYCLAAFFKNMGNNNCSHCRSEMTNIDNLDNYVHNEHLDNSDDDHEDEEMDMSQPFDKDEEVPNVRSTRRTRRH